MKLEVKNDVLPHYIDYLKKKVNELGRRPVSCVIQVGDNPSSNAYITGKKNVCSSMDIDTVHIKLDENITEGELVAEIIKLNNDDTVDGILVQFPLPKHMDEGRVSSFVSKDKDTDCFNLFNVGDLYSANYIRKFNKDDIDNHYGVLPCTAKACMDILDYIGESDLTGKKAVVIGRSNLVGKPVSKLLMDRNATVITCHSRTKEEDLVELLSTADIIVVAVGIKHFLKKNMLTNKKVYDIIIDVGINVDIIDGKRKLFGDIHPDCYDSAKYYTPVPGGVGVLTCLNVGYNIWKMCDNKKNNK